MKAVAMMLSALKQPEKNVRIHTEQQLKEFERSVTMFGQLRPIVVDEDNVILAGNGLYETLVRMGKEKADVLKMEGLTPNQKKKLMIADNKIFSLGIENLDTFNEFLTDLNGDLDIPGYDTELLTQMVADTAGVTEQLSGYGTISPEEAQEIREQEERRNAHAPETAQGASIVPVPVQNDTSGGDRPFVVCPKCGEKIWL